MKQTGIVYLAGWGRSGSTMLDTVLGQVDGFCSVGEIKFLWERGFLERRRCGCGEPLPDCPFWAPVVADAIGAVDSEKVEALDAASRAVRTRHLPLILAPGSRRWYRRDLGWYRRDLSSLYRAIAYQAQARWVVDSSKYPGYAFLLNQIPQMNLRLVHVVRDPRAVAYSWTRIKHDPDAPGEAEMPRLPPWATALYWSTWNAAVASIAKRGDIPRLVVRYEDLTSDPRSQIRRILDWLGEDDVSLPFVGPSRVRLSPSHTVSGNPIRFQTGEVQIRADDEWRQGLSAREQKAVWGLSWPARRRYGYR